MPVAATRAMIVFAHGARDGRSAQMLNTLMHRVQAHAPQAVVTKAFTFCFPPSRRAETAAAGIAGHCGWYPLFLMICAHAAVYARSRFSICACGIN
jgi:sirohydrochlorin ferrochelatase